MGALTIAFDTTIVGALALSWVLLVIHLFFLDGENGLEGFLGRVKNQLQPAAAGVLLFALTYTLGSIVSRTAKDFFDDDDLHVEVGGRDVVRDDAGGHQAAADDNAGGDNGQKVRVPGHLFRVGVTEGRILTRVYCDSSKNGLLVAGQENPVLAKRVHAFQNFKDREKLCRQTLSWSVGRQISWQDDELNQYAEDIVGLQENALMVKGGDYTVRLRQLHDQIMVLRGAAFNGFIGFSLCLFAWGAKLRRARLTDAKLEDAKTKSAKTKIGKLGSWLGRALMLVPALYLAVAWLATFHHFGERATSDPPYMEFTLIFLALMGAWLVWKPSSWQEREHAQASQARPVDAPAGKDTETKFPWRIEHWMQLAALSAVLTTAAFLGWWSTEMLYGEQVIYSYASQVLQNQGTAATQP
jgi:hypothetical protein